MPDAYNPWGAPVFPTAADNAMQPETFVPQGVRDWTQQAAPKDYNILSQIAGSLGKALMYPGQVAQSKEPISTEDMVAPAFNLASMLTLGAGAAPQEANALNMGIKAYHGSPHDFDKFDLSKIGTGEGAQAYGHGLYFAENEGVAKGYKEALAGKGLAVRETVEKHLPDASLSQEDLSAIYRAALNGDKDAQAAARSVQMAASSLRDPGVSFMGPPGERGQKIANAIADIREQGRGHMYEVNINADPSHFLDWDKPLSQQTSQVQDRVAAIIRERGGSPSYWAQKLGENPDGRKLVSELGLGDTAGLSSNFHQAGIPGIKYLDQGSRVAPPDGAAASISMFESALRKHPNDEMLQQQLANAKAQMAEWEKSQSRNYVVFNHDLIDIMRKYAVPGMLGAPILANALSEQKT